MTTTNVGREPVPQSSRLLALQFLSGIAPIVNSRVSKKIRWTLHRVLYRNQQAYLQQLCPYLPQSQYNPEDTGRIFSTAHGIIGESFQTRSTLRSKVSEKNESTIAIPFLDLHGSTVFILFAQANQQGYFNNSELIDSLAKSCSEFSDFLGLLSEQEIFGVINYPLESHKTVKKDKKLNIDLYDKLELEISSLIFSSLNFEAP